MKSRLRLIDITFKDSKLIQIALAIAIERTQNPLFREEAQKLFNRLSALDQCVESHWAENEISKAGGEGK